MAKIPQETGRGFTVTDSAAIAVNNVTTETSLFNQTISASKMGSSKTLTFSAFCMLTTPALSLPALTVRLKFGSSTLLITSGLSLAASMVNEPFMIRGQIINKSSSSQIVWARIEQGANSIPLLLGISSAFKGAKWTEDTTVDKTFSLTAQFSLLSSGTTLSAEHVLVELS